MAETVGHLPSHWSRASDRWHNGPIAEHYQRPGWFTTNVFNRVKAALTHAGVSVYGSRVLDVKGRKSGEWRDTPVNLLRHGGTDYLVAPRGHTQWVKNLRASGEGRLRVGRRVQAFSAVELAGDEKPPLLRAYLKKWKFEYRRRLENVRSTDSHQCAGPVGVLARPVGYRPARAIPTLSGR